MNTNNKTNSNSNRPVYVNRHGQAQNQPRQQRPQQRMQRPQPMERPQPMISPIERQEQERRQWLAKLPPGISHRSYSWLFEEPQNPGMQVKVVSRPVAVKAEPVAVRPHVKRVRSLSREDLAEAFALEKKELTDAYLASMARQRKLESELSKKKAELVALGMVKKGEVVPDAFKRNGVFLSFEVEHQLRKARHVIAEMGQMLVLSEEAKNDPTSPWAAQTDWGRFIAQAMRELVDEVKSNPMVRPDHGVWTRRPEVESDYDAMQNELTSRRYVPAGKRKARPERAPRISASLSRTAPVKAAPVQKALPVAADGPVARPEPKVVDLLAPAGKSRRVW